MQAKRCVVGVRRYDRVGKVPTLRCATDRSKFMEPLHNVGWALAHAVRRMQIETYPTVPTIDTSRFSGISLYDNTFNPGANSLA